MYPESFKQKLLSEIASVKEAGLYKEERIITSPQGSEIILSNGQKVLNFCANNYLGLSSHPKVIEAAHQYIDSHGFGMSSVRFICGTQDIHKKLEEKIFIKCFHCCQIIAMSRKSLMKLALSLALAGKQKERKNGPFLTILP